MKNMIWKIEIKALVNSILLNLPKDINNLYNYNIVTCFVDWSEKNKLHFETTIKISHIQCLQKVATCF
jgi:hypothetical protein